MSVKRVVLFAGVGAMLWLTIPCVARAQAAAAPKIYNTAKQKMLQGKQIIGGTITSPDPNMYCAEANAGVDFTWIEMQHSPLNYFQVAALLKACPHALATPMIRVPDATESDIQKALDIGALGIVVPTVDTVEKAELAVKWAKYPPFGRRSQGGGQYREFYGADYRQTANDNVMVIIMIETPLGAANAEKIAAVPGIDVIFAASGDMGSFSGFKQGQTEYEALITKVHDAALKAGLKVGGPLNWISRPGYSFFQAPDETSFIPLGVQATLKSAK